MNVYKVRYSSTPITSWENTLLANNFAEAYGKVDKTLREMLKTDSKHKVDILYIKFDSEVCE